MTRPLFDQLHSLGQYTTIVRAEPMSLGELVKLVGDSDRRLDDEARDKQIWAVEIEIKLIGTPDGPEPAYSLVGIDAEDGGLELITTSQSPVLLAAAKRPGVFPAAEWSRDGTSGLHSGFIPRKI